MAQSDKPFKKVRLFKLAKELHVSIDTLTEYLDEHGYKNVLRGKGVNASLTDEDAYLALREEYAQDREAAERIRELRAQRRAAQEAAERAESGEEEEVEVPPVEDESVQPEAAPATVETLPMEPVADEVPAIVEDLPAVAPVAEAPVPAEDEPPAETIVEEAIAEPVEAPLELPEDGQPDDANLPGDAIPGDAAPEIDEEAAAPALDAPEEATDAADEASETEEVDASDGVVEAEPINEATDEDESVDADASDDESDKDAEVVSSSEAEGEEDETVIQADRYKLTGTTVLGKIDLKSVESDPSRKRKRKRKRKGDTPEKPERAAAKPASDKASSSSGPKKKKKTTGKKKTKVDQADVEKTLQETLRDLEQGASRVRQRRRRQRREDRAAEREAELLREQDKEQTLRVTEFVSTGELANLMDVSATDIIGRLFSAGMMVSINQRLDADTIQFVADEYGFDIEFITEFTDVDLEIEEDDPADLEPRAPVVTIMGHVDHGKTSLLDYIRDANVVAGEAGGITQHIGAYRVSIKDGRVITFLDTPGHEAFTAMRARGAQVTDIVILVVAADDAVMPQTREAINHARAAGVPMVVAINKIDKNSANPQRVIQQLSEENVLVEQWGGNIQCSEVSAMTGQGVDELLEKVLLESELLDLKANANRNAIGTVIESRLDKGRGVVSTVLVQNGTLEVGDVFVAGIYSGRVRAMFDERDRRIQEAGPSAPALILGLSGAPEVGDQLVGMDEERDARDISSKRQQIYREQTLRQRKHITLDEIGRRLALGDFRELNLIVKGDVGGSVEALTDSLLKLSKDEVAINIIHSGVGAINESDVMLANASDAIIIGFQVRPVPSARAIAEREEIDIRTYSIIYNAIAEVRDALEGLLSPEKSEKTLGTVEVRETFKVPKIGTIAGCYVLDGKIHRNDKIRIIRDGVVIYNGTISSLKRFKDDVREVVQGYECGIGIHNYNDVKVGDIYETFEIVETKRTLEDV
ncbi:MAG: translation initiation factor IF-2 [Rhodothermales bacterium]